MRSRAAAVIVGLVLLVAAMGAGGERDRVIDVPGVKSEVKLLAPSEDGAGRIPTFKWKRVDGADRYRLAVLDAKGRATWVWQGSKTSVVFGGVVNRPSREAGPIVTPGSKWSVVALDADGVVIATSRFRAVAP